MRRLGASLGWGATALLWAPTAAAQPASAERSACERAQVTVSGTFASDWDTAIEDLCRSLGDLPDRDRTARLDLTAWPEGGGVHVTLHLADGRSAERDASTPRELSALVVALVTLPPESRPTPEPAKPAGAGPQPKPKAAAPAVSAAPSTGVDVAVDLALMATGRILGRPTTLGVGAAVAGDLDIDHGWIVGLRGRVDPVQADVEHSGELETMAVGGGVELARRIRIERSAAVDVGLGADVLADIPIEAGVHDDARGDVRPRAFAKVWAPGDGVSFIGSLAVELSPLRLTDEDPNPGPAVGLELGAGVAWGGL